MTSICLAEQYDIRKKVINKENTELPCLEKGILFDSNKYDGMHSEEAITSIIKDLQSKELGEGLVQFRLRDWGISRQRYWGCPIPVVYKDGEASVVEESELPVKHVSYTHLTLPTKRIV